MQINSNWEMIPYLALGLVAGLAAPPFLRGLRASEKLFARTGLPQWGRLMLGGLAVGALADPAPGSLRQRLQRDRHPPAPTRRLALADNPRHPGVQAPGHGGDVWFRRSRRRVHPDAFYRRESWATSFGELVQKVWPISPPPVLSVFTLVGMGAFLWRVRHTRRSWRSSSSWR